LHRGRHRHGAHRHNEPVTSRLPGERAALGERPDALLHEQRVALGLAEDHGAQRLEFFAAAEQAAQQRRAAFPGQRIDA
jgi:hypothetical protein